MLLNFIILRCRGSVHTIYFTVCYMFHAITVLRIWFGFNFHVGEASRMTRCLQ